MIPTVNVTVAVHEQDGSPVRGALVFARLTAVERYNGYVVADEYTGRTDERGRAVVAVFPNELGSEGSEYRFRIVTPAGKTFSVYATVPNNDCNLHQICELEPAERRGAGQVISSEIAGYAAQAGTARDMSQEAANRAQGAAVQVDVSAQTATAAASLALSNANTAKRAAEGATGLVQRTETVVAGFESEVIGRVEAETQRLGGEASTAISTAKEQAMTALDAHTEQKAEGLDSHAADLKAALTASLGTQEEEAIGAVRIERDAALVVLREEGAQFREDLNTLAERSEDAAKRAACSAATTVKAAFDVDEALTDTALELLAPQVVAEAVRQATEIALDSANTATVEAEKSRQSAETACACADESAASAQSAADSATAAETSAGAAADSASAAASSEAVATTKAGEASASATAAKVSEGAAKASEESAADSARTATTKAGEATASAAAAGVSEANAVASATAASASATIASAAQTAAEAAYEETKKVAVFPATTSSRGSVKADGATIGVKEDGTITAKDVAIGGDLGDLASVRGQIGDYRTKLPAGTDLNDIISSGTYIVSSGNCANVPMNGMDGYYVLRVFGDATNPNAAVQKIYSRMGTAGPEWSRRRISDGTWQPWQQLVQANYIGDGIRVSRSKALSDGTGGLCILSVPEMQGATASSAGTSGLVPPATAGQRESFLTGGGEYKPALSTGGGIMSGSIQINSPATVIGSAPSVDADQGLFIGDKNGTIMGGFDLIQGHTDNAKYAQIFSKNTHGDVSYLAAITYEDRAKEIVTDSALRISDIQISTIKDSGNRVIIFSGNRGNEGLALRYSPDNGELYMDGRAMHGKADTAGHADSAGTTTTLATPRTINGVVFDGSKNITVADPTKLPLSGGIMTGGIQINDPTNDVAVAPPANTERGLFLADKNGAIMGGFDVIQRASDNAKWTQIFAKNSKGQFTTLSIDIKETGEGEINSTSPIQINDVRISRVFDNGVRLISLSGARDNEGLPLRYSPDNGELYLDGRAVHGKADTAGHANTAQSAYGLTGAQVISFNYPNTQALPGYGTWMAYFTLIAPGSIYNTFSDIMPGGTVLSLDREHSVARGLAIRIA